MANLKKLNKIASDNFYVKETHDGGYNGYNDYETVYVVGQKLQKYDPNNKEDIEKAGNDPDFIQAIKQFKLNEIKNKGYNGAGVFVEFNLFKDSVEFDEIMESKGYDEEQIDDLEDEELFEICKDGFYANSETNLEELKSEGGLQGIFPYEILPGDNR